MIYIYIIETFYWPALKPIPSLSLNFYFYFLVKGLSTCMLRLEAMTKIRNLTLTLSLLLSFISAIDILDNATTSKRDNTTLCMHVSYQFPMKNRKIEEQILVNQMWCWSGHYWLDGLKGWDRTHATCRTTLRKHAVENRGNDKFYARANHWFILFYYDSFISFTYINLKFLFFLLNEQKS